MKKTSRIALGVLVSGALVTGLVAPAPAQAGEGFFEVLGGVTLIGGDEGRVGMCLLENKSEVSKGCSNAMNDVGLEVVEE